MARAVHCFVWLAALLLMASSPVHALMFGYATNATGIYRIDVSNGASTLLYSGSPFNGSTFVAAAAQRASDGMLFFLYNNTTNQSAYRWDPAAPSVAPVLLGTTGSSVPYIHRLAFNPGDGNLYGSDVNGTVIWRISQTTGAATNVATISGIPGNSSGDIAFSPIDGRLYAPVQPSNSSTATIYRVSLTGGAVVNAGTITGLSTNSVLNSVMFGPDGTMYIGGDSTNLKTAPVTGGPAVTVGNMGFTPQDFASVPSADPAVSKSFAPSTVSINGNSTLTITLSNSNPWPLRGAAISDTYPAGLVNAPTPAASTTCGGTVTAAAGGNSVSLAGGTIPAGGSCTIAVNVRAATVGSYVNTLPARSLSTVLASNENSASATLVVSTATLTHVKSVQVVSDPYNGSVNPKAIPGADMLYSLLVTNTGGGSTDNNSIAVVDPIPANTRLYLGDLAGAGSGPVQFINGSPASGLTWTYTSLGNGTDDLEFYKTGPGWSHTPTPDANGYDTSGTESIRMKPKGTMPGNTGSGSPNFQLRFRVRIN